VLQRLKVCPCRMRDGRIDNPSCDDQHPGSLEEPGCFAAVTIRGMDEQAFLEAIDSNPGDVLQRLIYADWLEEQGDWRGEYIRRRHDLEGAADPLAVLKQMLPLFRRH